VFYLRRTSYGAVVALDERLSRDELVKDGCGQRACSAHGGNGDLLLKSEWDGHDQVKDARKMAAITQLQIDINFPVNTIMRSQPNTPLLSLQDKEKKHRPNMFTDTQHDLRKR
jgi:hypothetical protein